MTSLECAPGAIATGAVVVDADVASFFVNDDPVRVPRYEPHLLGRGIIVPFAAFAEMLFGAEVKNWDGPAGPICPVSYVKGQSSTPINASANSGLRSGPLRGAGEDLCQNKMPGWLRSPFTSTSRW
jgi:hypothetical protein